MEMIFIATLIEMVLVIALLAIFFLAGKIVWGGRVKGLNWSKPDHVESRAIVLNVEQTGLFLNQHAHVKLQVRVIGGRTFVSELQELLSARELAGIHSGATVMVRYNPDTRNGLVLVKAA